MAAPLGFRVDGGYGFSLFRSPDDLAQARKAEYSEKDVLQVLALRKKHYKIDGKRIYLMGHSMGAIGTWALFIVLLSLLAAAIFRATSIPKGIRGGQPPVSPRDTGGCPPLILTRIPATCGS